MAWRGRAIAVLDLGAITETADPLKPGEERPRAVVIQLGAMTLAIPVEAAREVREVAAERLRNPHATRQRYALHEVDLDGVPTPVVDLGGILSSVAQEGPATP
jgi:chemotaxis signal transduction protein